MSEIMKSIILRCSYPDDAKWLTPNRCALICDGELSLLDGYGAYIISNEINSPFPENALVFSMPESCESGEFLRLEFDKGNASITRLVTADIPERTLFLTEQCNSNCIMCPYGSKRRSNGHHLRVDELLEYIELMNPETEYLCITGGEPTLLRDGFLTILEAVKKHMPYALVHILTNGRTFFYRDFFKAYQAKRPFQTLLGIPLHASNEILHDSITGVSGSFRQTIRGLENCYAGGEHIELRIVTSALNIHNIRDLAEFISDRFPAVNHVCFMGLEMMGNAMFYREKVWVDFETLMPEVEKAVEILLSSGIAVRLYNYPLCKVNKKYRTLYYRSISENKIKYKPECEKCLKKEECGGFFQTTVVMPSIVVTPYC